MASSYKREKTSGSYPDMQNLPNQEQNYFPFPFTPYEIQVEFMKELYSVLEKGGVGIFESPTGTVSSTTLSDFGYMIVLQCSHLGYV